MLTPYFDGFAIIHDQVYVADATDEQKKVCICREQICD
jgi:hypothetical protein